jgi:hypothetical protein
VAELAAHDVETDAGGERELRVAVASTMQRDRRDAGRSYERLPPTEQRVRLPM